MKERRDWRTRRYPIRRRVSPRSVKADRFGSHREQAQYAHNLWREIIRRKEPSGVCPMCRARRWVDAAHNFARGPYPMLRFEIDNGAPLCRVCHRRVDSDHHAKREFFMRYIGPEAYMRLELRAQSRAKTDLKLTILHLESLGGEP